MGSYLWIGLLLLAALWLLWLSARGRQALGLPQGRMLYRDTASGMALEKPLFAADLDLVGRPDYLLRTAKGLVPIEVKSGRSPRQPYESDLYQLAAYCALVERAYGERPPYGVIRYADGEFKVEYTAELEKGLLRVLDEMRADMVRAEVHRSHQQAARCHACGYVSVCGQAL